MGLNTFDMSALPINKLYGFQDEFKIPVSIDFCERQIKSTFFYYSRESLLRALSFISIELGTSNHPELILEIQQKVFSLPPDKKVYIINRQAIIILFQFIYSSSEKTFGDKSNVSTRDIFRLFILTNDLINLTDNFNINKSLQKRLLFNTIKSIHIMRNENDLQADFEMFKRYGNKIKELNNQEYNKFIVDQLGLSIGDFLAALQQIKDRTYENVFSLFDKFAVIDIDAIESAWSNREPKLEIPYEYNFIMKYPLIKIENEYLLTDSQFLITSLFRRIYEILVSEDKEKFKGLFGEKITEPVLKDFIKEVFNSDKIKNLNVSFKSRQFADSGLLYKNDIFLFEIKTSLLNNSVLFSKEYDYFIKGFNNKFILREGAHQQVKRLIEIDKDFQNFLSLTNLNPYYNYKIYPILLVFDEKLQTYLANWYISTRFDNLKRCHHFIPQNYSLSNNHITITINELFRLNTLSLTTEQKIELIKHYADDYKHIVPFEIFLQQLGLFNKP